MSQMMLSVLIPQLIMPNPPIDSVRSYIETTHKMATVYLRWKALSGRLAGPLIGLSVEDIAMDCIAELFKIDNDGYFPKLCHYYKDLIEEPVSEEMYFIKTRRLVFSTVNQELFRIYSEHDPGLSKIVRSLKRALKFNPDLHAERRSGEFWIYIDGSPSSGILMPSEFLESRLGTFITPKTGYKEILSAVSMILSDQSDYMRSYPLSGLAMICRSVFHSMHYVGDVDETADDNISPAEITRLIIESVNEIRIQYYPKYVENKGIDPQYFDWYLSAVEQVLIAQYVLNDGFDVTYYEQLNIHMHELTQESYINNHRSYVEYLIKLSRQHLLHKIQPEL